MSEKRKTISLPIIVALIGVLGGVVTTSLTIFRDDIEAMLRARRASKELISDVTASSSLLPQYYMGEKRTYDPSNVADSNQGTAWVEGVQGDGINEWVKITFEKEVVIKRVSIVGAYAVDAKRFRINNRLKKARISFSDNHSKTVDFIDSIDPQVFDLGRSVKTTWIRIEILDVYHGTHYPDTPISEIFFP